MSTVLMVKVALNITISNAIYDCQTRLANWILEIEYNYVLKYLQECKNKIKYKKYALDMIIIINLTVCFFYVTFLSFAFFFHVNVWSV